MAKRKRKPKEITLIEKLKPESFGEFASMCFAGGRNGQS
jgi:hypothetical protein